MSATIGLIIITGGLTLMFKLLSDNIETIIPTKK